MSALPARGVPGSLSGRYPLNITRQRYAQQGRALRLARRILQWGEDIMTGRIEATTEQKLALAKLILPRALPALSEQNVAATSMSVTATVDERRIFEMASALVREVQESEREPAS